MFDANRRNRAQRSSLVRFVDLEQPAGDFRADVLAGLADSPRRISPKWLYDAAGSELFDRICETPEYYVTRTEIALLESAGPDIARRVPKGAAVVEYGAGSSVKIRTLIDALNAPTVFMAIDISGEHLLAAAQDVADDHPDLNVVAVCADFTLGFDLPTELLGGAFRLGFLPGSTIGNFERKVQIEILSRIARQLGPGAGLLIGADLIKDKARLEAAYDDAGGVTARFSLNLLERMQRELGAGLAVEDFAHVAVYDEEAETIRIWIEARRDTRITIADRTFAFARGDKINTEIAQKYTFDSFRKLAETAGLRAQACWSDPKELISLHYLIVA